MRYYFEIAFNTFGKTDEECKEKAYQIRKYIDSLEDGQGAEIIFQSRSDFGKRETLKNEL